jgi:cysteinyl-tRNA synthetase
VEGRQADEPDDAKWAAPFGPGRPGWHIECSAMSCALLGEHFDIHGGGMDLQFPHHENEIAQSEGANGTAFVNVWMHNGFLNVDNEKMSKSLGNFFTIADVLKSYDGETLRFFMLRTHYRSPFNFSDANLDDARRAAPPVHGAGRAGDEPAGDSADRLAQPQAAAFRAAMDDDFNTPGAWPCCSNWRPSSTAAAPLTRRCCCGAGPARWACCSSARAPTCRPALAWTRRRSTIER